MYDHGRTVLASPRIRRLRQRAPIACVLLTLLLASCGGSGGGDGSPVGGAPTTDGGAVTPGEPDAGGSTDLSDDPASNPTAAVDAAEESDPDPVDESAVPAMPGGGESGPGPGEIGCEADAPPVRLALQTPSDALPAGVLSTRIAERAGSASDGSACVGVFPGASLFDAEEALDALADGELEIAVVSMTDLSNRLPEYAVFDLPYLFGDIAALERFQTGEGGAALLQGTSRDGLRPIGFVNAGLVQTSADREIGVPADLSGTRVVGRDSPLFRNQYAALGAVPIRLAFGERYAALLSGVVDAQESLWSVADASRFTEVQPFFTETNHRVAGHVLLVAADWWSALDPDDRSAFERLFATALAESGGEAREAESAAREAIVETGVELRTLGLDERAAWVEAMQPVWRSAENAIGVDLIGSAVAANGDDTARAPGSVTPDTRPVEAPVTPPRPAAHPAEGIVVDSTGALLRALSDEATGPEIERIVTASFDLETMTSLALGAARRDADATQSARLVEEFGTLLSRVYAEAVFAYRDGGFVVDPFVREAREDRAVIRSTLTRTGEPALSLVHRLRERNGWSVFDVELDGISLVTGYRAAFADVVERGGIDALIEELARLNASA